MKLILVFMFASVAAFAGVGEGGTGSGVGGGGTAVILPDDTVILADPFVSGVMPTDGELGRKVKLAPELEEEVLRGTQMLARYAGLSLDWDASPFRTEAFFSDSVEFRMVDKIPGLCPYQTPDVINLPPNARIEPIACTKGNYTWIREELFKKMSVREQAKLILHERLRTTSLANDLAADRLIADVTNGLDVTLRLFNALVRGERPIPTDAEFSILDKLRMALQRFGKGTSYIDIASNGGGIIEYVSPSDYIKYKNSVHGYVGVGSIVANTAEINEGAAIYGFSAICRFGKCLLEKDSVLAFPGGIATNDLTVHLMEGARFVNSSFSVLKKLTMEPRTVIENVDLSAFSASTSSLDVNAKAGSKFTNLLLATMKFKRYDRYVALGGLGVGFIAAPVGLFFVGVPALAAVTVGGAVWGGFFLDYTHPRPLVLTIDGTIDAENKYLCGTENSFADKLTRKARIRSLAELVDRCTTRR